MPNTKVGDIVLRIQEVEIAEMGEHGIMFREIGGLNIFTRKEDVEIYTHPRCPHGRYTSGEPMPAFAGGISTCSCCHNEYGHFGEPADNRCSTCHEDK